MLAQIPQQVIGHLRIARVAVGSFEAVLVELLLAFVGVVAGLGQQAAHVLLPEPGFVGALAGAAGRYFFQQPAHLAHLPFEVGGPGIGQQFEMLAHVADDLLQVIVINLRRAFLRGQKLPQVVHQVGAVVVAQLRVEAGHAQPILAQQRQNCLKLLRPRPDVKHTAADGFLRRPPRLQRLLGLVQVIETALKRHRGKAHLLAQKAQQPDFGLEYIALAVGGLAQHHHPRRANLGFQKF